MRRQGFSLFGRAGPSGSLRPVSRRQFFGTSAGAAGVVLGSSLWTAAEDGDDEQDERENRGHPCPAPDPIPHVTIPPIPSPVIAMCARAHFFFPGNVEGTAAPTDPTGPHPGGRDPSTLFDFDGVIGQADLNLTGTGTDTTTGESKPYDFHTDMRFMAGKFVGTDGRVHKGAFAFI
jgi:hypothetical protein